MKNFSADLQQLLASGAPVHRYDLFAIGPLLNGEMIYATNGGGPVTYAGNVYQPVQWGQWSRDAVQVKAGLVSNSTTLKVLCGVNVPVLFPGTTTSLLDGIKFGLLGMAAVSIFTAYMPVYSQVTGPTGGILVEVKFVGEVAGVENLGQTSCTVQVQDLIYRLNQQIPVRVIQASCSWVLYSTGCTLNSTSFQRTGAVGTVVSNNQFHTTAHLAPVSSAGTFTLGQVRWTSGRNTGLTSFVSVWTPGLVAVPDLIQLDVAPVFGIAAGDTFTIVEGCNHTFASCLNLQPNTAYNNYGGQPDTPVPETAI